MDTLLQAIMIPEVVVFSLAIWWAEYKYVYPILTPKVIDGVNILFLGVWIWLYSNVPHILQLLWGQI